MKLHCLKTNQRGGDLYTGIVRAEVLTELLPGGERRGQVDVWTPDNPHGYQRDLAKRRINEVVHYLLKAEGVFPTSVLLSYREEDWRFDSQANSDEGVEYGVLEVDDDQPLWIIDGQHRIAALQTAIEELGEEEFRDYPVPFTLLVNADVFEEARWFFVVNSKAKKVPIDLAERLLAEAVNEKGEDWLRETETRSEAQADKLILQTRLVEVVDRLAEGPTWSGWIIRPGEEKGRREAVKAHTFITSLTRGAIGDSSVQRILMDDANKMAELLDRFWQAIDRRWPTAMAGGYDFSIRRTQGLYSLHAIFPDVLERCREAKDYSVENMLESLNGIDVDDEFWSRDEELGHPLTMSTSMASLRRLARFLREQLPELVLAGF